MEINVNDPIFTERGIDPKVALARGYVMWDDSDYHDVIDTAFAGLSRGALNYLKRMAGQEPGIVITRFSPLRPDEEVVPEIRPNKAVQTSTNPRHYHAEGELDIFALLPSVVSEAYCLPQGGKVVKLKFSHAHDTLNEDELAQHLSDWHGANVPNNEHFHTLVVLPPDVASEHIKNEGGKFTNQHKGVNHSGVHQHINLAKYLFAPSRKEERSGDTVHNHAKLTPKELVRHLAKFHPEDERNNTE